MSRARLTLLLLLPLLATACGRRPPAPSAPPPSAPPPASARAAAIRAAAAAQPALEGRRDSGGVEATWRASFAGAEPVLIEERLADGPRPPLTGRYYFEHGALFYYEGEQPAEAGGGAEGPAPRAAVVAEFDGARLLRAVRIEHYGEVPLPAERGGAIARRAAELAAAARDERAAQKVAP